MGEFKDEGISGTKGRDRRPGFDTLHRGIIRRDFDMVAAWSVDRLGRSLQDLIGFLSELKSKDVDLYLHPQSVDTSTPAGRALFPMLGVFVGTIVTEPTRNVPARSTCALRDEAAGSVPAS